MTAAVLHPMAFLEDNENGGLNIEGAAVNQDGHLLVGLRSPLTGSDGLYGDAIVVALNMFEPAQVLDVHTLDLSDRGIRRMTSHDGGFAVIAGDVNGRSESALFQWAVGGEPILVEGVDTSRLNPESVVSGPNGLILLSDDSSAPRLGPDGRMVRCKTLQDQADTDSAAPVFAEGLELLR